MTPAKADAAAMVNRLDRQLVSSRYTGMIGWVRQQSRVDGVPRGAEFGYEIASLRRGRAVREALLRALAGTDPDRGLD